MGDSLTCAEPNNESPLNSAAATLWSNQEGAVDTISSLVLPFDMRLAHIQPLLVEFRRVLLTKYSSAAP